MPNQTMEVPPLDRVLAAALAYGEKAVWDRIVRPELRPELRARDVFTYALVLCVAERDLWRVPKLLAIGRRMQDLRPKSKSFGNFWWRWSDRKRPGRVPDTNAVEFCLPGATLILTKCRHLLTPGQRRLLVATLRDALVACRRHRVPLKHTNISMLRTTNLILTGEAIGDGRAVRRGTRALEDLCTYTWEWGIHEYCSPTYTPIQIYAMAFLKLLASDPAVREQASALLDIVWNIAELNWIPDLQRLGGAQCRQDELYLEGDGAIDEMMWVFGKLSGDAPPEPTMNVIFAALTGWIPPDHDEPSGPFGIGQSWGPSPLDARSCYVDGPVRLSTANHGFDYPKNQDLPLTVDMPATEAPAPRHENYLLNSVARNAERCYFVPSDRMEPYTLRYRHLVPMLWTATQNTRDALGVVMYKPLRRDLLQSNFVIPLGLDMYGMASRRHFHEIVPDPCSKQQEKDVDAEEHRIHRGRTPLDPGNVFAALRVVKGVPSAFAIRVLWAVNYAGEDVSPIFYYDDAGADVGAARLAITHHRLGEPPLAPTQDVGALFWVRVAHGLDQLQASIESDPNQEQKDKEISPVEAAFKRWAKDFAGAKSRGDVIFDTLLNEQNADVSTPLKQLKWSVDGVDGKLKIRIRRSKCDCLRFVTRVAPTPPKSILRQADTDLGRDTLGKVGYIKLYEDRLAASPQIMAPPADSLDPVTWSAASGRVQRPMKTRYGKDLGNVDFVWMPQKAGGGSSVGSVAWRLQIPTDGDYVIWGRVRSPGPGHDQLIVTLRPQKNDTVSVIGDDGHIGPATWYLGRNRGWTWVPLNLGEEGACLRPRVPSKLTLREGDYTLHVFAAQSGVKLSQLVIQSALNENGPTGAA